MITLLELLGDAGLPVPAGAADATVSGVVHDSRLARSGSVFVAIPGAHADGHAHAAEAVERGAVAVVAERDPSPALPAGVPVILVGDTRAALAPLAAAAVGHPSRRLCVVGVTGTDGKTTTTTMLQSAWRGAGIRAASMTTVDFRSQDRVEPNTTRQTTLDAVDLQERLRTLLDEDCTHVAVETSSHALALHRVDCVDYRAAVFTRITTEHLDLHGTVEAYQEAKARLGHIVSARDDGIIVLDADDRPSFARLAAIPVGRRLTYSAAGRADADLSASKVVVSASGTHFVAMTPWGAAEVRLNLAGRFNAANALAAMAASCATGADLEGAVAGIAQLDRVDGRMERVDTGQPFAVVIDYAHTADSLQRVLDELRPATRSRLWVVFGSAGDRDRPKRAEMGGVAAQHADVAVITDEDPREEDRVAILEEIARGARQAGARDRENLYIVPDRDAAIAFAIDHAEAGDTVLCAGKGHESSIIVGTRAHPWSERRSVELALARRRQRDAAPA